MALAPAMVWRFAMNNLILSPPKFGFVVATRVALALGIGLLISQRLSEGRRRRVGRTLVTIGALATIPAAIFVARSLKTPGGRRIKR
jgi:Na+-driven multidrug efflux pump